MTSIFFSLFLTEQIIDHFNREVIITVVKVRVRDEISEWRMRGDGSDEEKQR